MSMPNDQNQPAQVPGDAESPPKGEEDRTAKGAVKRTDRTEPVESEQTSAGKRHDEG
ncbi:MAG TPA: hypothetical protein VGG99_07635 [Acetobacteraceae bacterium]|jgi:hypothetical protein